MSLRKPEKRIRTIWSFFSVVLAAVPGVLVAAAGIVLDRGYLPGVAVFLLVSVAGVIYSSLLYRSWGFELRDDHLYLEHGVFRKIYSMVPFVRVQHVDTQRGVVERLAGHSSVVVFTAGSRGADVSIPGLKPGDAEKIQERLRDVAISSEDRDAV